MPNILKKFFPSQESYSGDRLFSFLDFRGKIVAVILLLSLGIILQSWFNWKNYFDLQAKLKLTSTTYRQLNYLCALEKLGTEIPAKSVDAVRNNTTLDLEDQITKMDQAMRKLDQKALGKQLDQVNQSFKTLVTQIKYYQIFNINEQQYRELSVIYQRYHQTLLDAVKKLNGYYTKNVSVLVPRILLLFLGIILLIILIVLSGWLVLSATYSITVPANLMIKFFQSDFFHRGDYQLPVYSYDGLGAAAMYINQSFDRWDTIFTQVNNSLSQFEKIVQELVAELRNQDSSQGQLHEIHKIINNYLEEQNETVKNINEQLTFLVTNLAIMQRIPFQLIQKSEKIEHLLLINGNKLSETLNQPLEIVDDTKPFPPLFQDLMGTSNQIKNVTTILREIAEHTELLAFNTAIEAAKAGTKGLGFSVVSKEITKLVERSKQAALNLNNNIKDFQNKTDLIIKLLPKTTITEDTITQVRGKTNEICSAVQNAVRDSVINLGHLAQVLEEIYSKTGQISQEAKQTSNLSFEEKEILKQIGYGILDYQMSVKNASQMAEQIETVTQKLLATLNPPAPEVVPPEPEPIG
ncbi:MAG TPA: methyl-accepting chemotaxis protein [Bacillota bacterium]|nr:methyl-accepting chemotaxis protein [Bacillota bacterium]